MSAPQFGRAEPGHDYPDRAAAFAVVEREGLIALVQVDEPGFAPRLDLPGGGIDPGETGQQAPARECGEEAGLRVELDPEPFVHADHYFRPNLGARVNTRGAFFAGRVLSEAPHLKIEDDHTLLWMAPDAALARLSRESHAWAVTTWLRLNR